MKERLADIENRKAELVATLETRSGAPVRLLPNLVDLYRDKVANLADSLNAAPSRLKPLSWSARSSSELTCSLTIRRPTAYEPKSTATSPPSWRSRTEISPT